MNRKTPNQQKEINHKGQSRKKWKKKMKETTVQINKTKSQFFENITKTNKPLARLIKEKQREESNQQNQK